MQYSVCLAETLLRRYPDPDSYPYQSWSYPQGFLLWGFIRPVSYTHLTLPTTPYV